MTTDLEPLADACIAMPYARAIGLAVSTLEPGLVRLRLPYRDENGNRNGTLHGGVLAGLVDTAGALAAATGLPPGDAATTDLVVHYLAAAHGEEVVAEARVRRAGRAIAFVSVDVTSAAGTLVATGLVARRTGGTSASDADPVPSPLDGISDDELRSAQGSGSPFTSRLGVVFAKQEAGRAVVLLPFSPEFTDGADRLHEGTLAALTDCAGGVAAWSVHGFDLRSWAATIGMHLSFGALPRGEGAVAVSTVPFRAGSLFVNDVAIVSRESSRPIATGSVTYRIVPRAG